MKTCKALKENLRNRRITLGFSQERMAEKLGIQLRRYQGIEGGEFSNLTLSTVESLADATKLEPWQLLFPGFVVKPPQSRVPRSTPVVTKVKTRKRKKRTS